MPWYQSKPHIWRNFLVFVAISQIWQENLSKYVVWIGTKAYIWRSYYLTIWRILRKLYIRIYKYMPWYHSKPHIWRYFLVCSNIANLAHRNSHKLAQIICLRVILLSGEFQENRLLGSTDLCHGTTHNHIFGNIFLCL